MFEPTMSCISYEIRCKYSVFSNKSYNKTQKNDEKSNYYTSEKCRNRENGNRGSKRKGVENYLGTLYL